MVRNTRSAHGLNRGLNVCTADETGFKKKPRHTAGAKNSIGPISE
jgi:hypothetical protein